MTRFFRSISLFFTALSAGFALSRLLQAQLHSTDQQPDKATAMNDSTLDLAGAALNGAALFSMFGLLVFGPNRRATIVSMASMAANDALWLMPKDQSTHVASIPVDLETGTEMPEQVLEPEPQSDLARQAARTALQTWSLASLIVASQQPPARKTMLERLAPQAKRFSQKASKRASKIAPGPVSQVEETLQHLQPVAERVIAEIRSHAPEAKERAVEARERAADFIEHAQPIAQRFLERAQQHAPTAKEAGDKAVQLVHDAPKQARGFFRSKRELLKAS